VKHFQAGEEQSVARALSVIKEKDISFGVITSFMIHHGMDLETGHQLQTQ
jgi:hypothetical protein